MSKDSHIPEEADDMLAIIRNKIKELQFVPLGKPKSKMMKVEKKRSAESSESDCSSEALPSRFKKDRNRAIVNLRRLQSVSSDIEDDDTVNQDDTSLFCSETFSPELNQFTQSLKHCGRDILITQSTSDSESEDDLKFVKNLNFGAQNTDILHGPKPRVYYGKSDLDKYGPFICSEEDDIILEVPAKKATPLNIEVPPSQKVPFKKAFFLQFGRAVSKSTQHIDEVPFKKASFLQFGRAVSKITQGTQSAQSIDESSATQKLTDQLNSLSSTVKSKNSNDMIVLKVQQSSPRFARMPVSVSNGSKSSGNHTPKTSQTSHRISPRRRISTYHKLKEVSKMREDNTQSKKQERYIPFD